MQVPVLPGKAASILIVKPQNRRLKAPPALRAAAHESAKAVSGRALVTVIEYYSLQRTYFYHSSRGGAYYPLE
jgi:hypothetical protein